MPSCKEGRRGRWATRFIVDKVIETLVRFIHPMMSATSLCMPASPRILVRLSTTSRAGTTGRLIVIVQYAWCRHFACAFAWTTAALSPRGWWGRCCDLFVRRFRCRLFGNFDRGWVGCGVPNRRRMFRRHRRRATMLRRRVGRFWFRYTCRASLAPLVAWTCSHWRCILVLFRICCTHSRCLDGQRNLFFVSCRAAVHRIAPFVHFAVCSHRLR